VTGTEINFNKSHELFRESAELVIQESRLM